MNLASSAFFMTKVSFRTFARTRLCIFPLAGAWLAAHYKDAVRVPGTMEMREPSPSTMDFMRSPPRFTRANTTNAPGRCSDSDSSRD